MRQSLFPLLGLTFLLLGSCQPDPAPPVPEPQLSEFTFSSVRLQDGVPLNLRLSIYWQAAHPETKATRPDSLLSRLLYARSLELSRQLSNRFVSADSVFSQQREDYVAAIKSELFNGFAETDLEIHDVIIRDVLFPASYTQALEQISLQKIKEDQIRKRNDLALAQAAADEKKAVAEGQVAIAKAEAQGRLQAIQARTEANRRKSELARAETEAAVARTRASAEADRPA
jgi:regulator of protease activity HflC (stomatin/prohibitin superfamily)